MNEKSTYESIDVERQNSPSRGFSLSHQRIRASMSDSSSDDGKGREIIDTKAVSGDSDLLIPSNLPEKSLCDEDADIESSFERYSLKSNSKIQGETVDNEIRLDRILDEDHRDQDLESQIVYSTNQAVENGAKNESLFQELAQAVNSLNKSNEGKASYVEIKSKGLDYRALIHSPLMYLGGKIEYFLSLSLFPYLSARELGRLSMSCLFFSQLIGNSPIWTRLYKLDFRQDYSLSLTLDSSSSVEDIVGKENPIYRRMYLSRLGNYTKRISRSKEEKAQLEGEMLRLDRIKIIEVFIDTVQVRLFVPLLSSCVFLSIVLYCQRVDGLISIPLYACAIPLAVAILYLLLSAMMLVCIQDRQYQTRSLLAGMWSNLRGPLVTFYTEVLSKSPNGMRGFQATCVVALIQLALVVLKLSWHSHTGGLSGSENYYWAIVFIPLWLAFFGFLTLPCLPGVRVDFGLFLLILVLVWMPCLIYFICLTVKLDHDLSIRIALFFIPFYILQGSFLFSSLVFLLHGVWR
jgi:hypothetical protein